MIRIGIVGATGYTGSELVRLLLNHPDAELIGITSESRRGEAFSAVHPFFQGIYEEELIGQAELIAKEPDLIFLALPHGVSMDFVKAYPDQRIIDLSGDFRLSGREVYQHWYQKDHTFEEGFKKAVFGLPELFRKEIEQANLVANPGCFPTSAILAMAPLIKEGLVDTNRIFVDSKTGVTGAGIKEKPTTHFPAVNDNFSAYGIKTHRHTIEIQEVLSSVAGANATVLFTPHLLPVDRGILSTCYLTPKNERMNDIQLKELYHSFYKAEPFVRFFTQSPTLKQVRGTNFADLYATYDERSDTYLAFGAIDNLVKGAAGQAIQNMNIMMGLEESTGLNQVPLQP